MRYREIIEEEQPLNTQSSCLKKQADAKSDQAKKLKVAAKVAKKRETVNGARSSLLKKQGELTCLLNKPANSPIS